jgi:hypothetical protein
MKDLLGFRVYPFVSYELMLIYYNATFCGVKEKLITDIGQQYSLIVLKT